MKIQISSMIGIGMLMGVLAIGISGWQAVGVKARDWPAHGKPVFPMGHADRGVAADYLFQTSAFMQHSAYRNVAKLDNDSAPDGAYGPVNRAWDVDHSGNIYIEEQRNGGDLILGGICANNQSAIKRGFTILKWGFDRQRPDGSFETKNPFHSTSFFVEATAHAFLLLQTSPYGGTYSRQIADLKPRLQQAAHWMIQPDVMDEGMRENQKFTHRRYLVACALGETGVLCHDRELVRHSEDFCRDGISLQSPEGYNPERGSYDSSYNSLGLVYAEQYYTLVADEDLRPPLFSMLQRGVAWQASRVNPDGSENTTGNSRVAGVQTETDRSGTPKHIAVGQIFRCFSYWAQISGDEKYEALAEQVAANAKMLHKPGE